MTYHIDVHDGLENCGALVLKFMIRTNRFENWNENKEMQLTTFVI